MSGVNSLRIYAADLGGDGFDNIVDIGDDGDGLPTREEVRYGTSDLFVGSGNDGVEDGEEVEAGRNPAVSEPVVIQLLINE